MNRKTETKSNPFLGARPNRREELFTGAMTFAFSMLFLSIGLILVQTTVFSTTNGLWKLVDARAWAEGNGRLVPANFTFTAVAANIYMLSEFFGILPTRGLAIWNSINIALASGLLSVLFLRITQKRLVSILLGLFFALSGGGLTHSLGSEDIAGAIPPIVIIFILISRGPISSFTKGRLFALSLSLAYVHLWEWRAALPIYLALFVVLLSEKPWRNVQKHLRIWVRIILVWIFVLAVTYVLVSMVFRLPGFDLGVFARYPFLTIIADSLFLGNYPVFLYLLGFGAVLWSGKGVGTIWGGFTEDKISFQVIGLTETLIGGRNIGSLWPNYSLWLLLLVALVYLVASYGAVISLRSSEWRQLGLMLVSYFIGSALFNLYSQPQDPQMQVTALPSTLLLIAFVAARSLRKGFKGLIIAWAGAVVILSLISVNSFQGGFGTLAATEWTDQNYANQADLLLQSLDLDRDVVFANGWEGEVTWIAFRGGGLVPLAWQRGTGSEGVKVLLASDLIFTDPQGEPTSWVCKAWEIIGQMRDGDVLWNVSGSRRSDMAGFLQIIDRGRLEQFQSLWSGSFTVRSSGEVIVDSEFLEGLCT
jgi:hypothetical protein